MNDPATPNEPDRSGIFIAVIRTGGIAGIPRRWRVAPPDDQAGQWIELIERCPWPEPGPAAADADRFVWSIHARTPTDERETYVADSALTGPWRELVDAVRDAAATPPDPPAASHG